MLKQLGVAIFGLYLGFSVARGAMQVFAPTPVPCYDFMDASATVLVRFNKCTGNIEVLQIVPPTPPPSEPAPAAPKVGV